MKFNNTSERIKFFHAIYEALNNWKNIKDLSEEERIEWETSILHIIYPYRNFELGDTMDDIIDILIKHDETWDPNPGKPHPLSFYKKQKFTSFMEYFTRELSDENKNSIKEKYRDFPLIMMSESDMESHGNISDTSKIISLKKPSEDVISTMKRLNCNLSPSYNFINTKLLITYYHRIHSPASGKIEKIIPVSKENNFFGKNSLNIVWLKTSFGNIYLLLVGESKIQDFEFYIKEGENVSSFQELGNFSWGSQTVLFYDGNNFGKKLRQLKEGDHLFVGDPLLE